jgi:hypothetical protein
MVRFFCGIKKAGKNIDNQQRKTGMPPVFLLY